MPQSTSTESGGALQFESPYKLPFGAAILEVVTGRHLATCGLALLLVCHSNPKIHRGLLPASCHDMRRGIAAGFKEFCLEK